MSLLYGMNHVDGGMKLRGISTVLLIMIALTYKVKYPSYEGFVMLSLRSGREPTP